MDVVALQQAQRYARQNFGQALQTAPASPSTGQPWMPVPKATPVIIDTDWWTDPSDVFALRVAAACERQGLIDIRAITMNATLKQGPASIDAMMTAESRPGILIGKSHTSHVPSGTPSWQSNMMNNNAHLLGMSSVVPDAVTVMRTVLANATRPVDIISVGYLNNLADLLASAADGISGMTGAQLVAAKVGTLWVMGGQYPSGSENNFNRTTTASAAASTVCSTWPTTIYFLGFEVATQIWTGGGLRSGYNTDIAIVGSSDQGFQYGRPSWDQMLVRMAALGSPSAAGFTTVRGTNSVNSSTGANTFTTGAGGPHYYVVKAQVDDYYVNDISPLLFPNAGASAADSGVQVYQDGKWRAANAASRRLGGVSTRTPTDSDSTLLLHLSADDLTDWNDYSSIAHWPDRTGVNTAQQYAQSSQRPSYRSTLAGSKPSMSFAGAQNMQTPYVFTPRDFTVYAYIYFSSLPVATQHIVTLDSLNYGGGTFPPKVFHLGVNSSAQVIADRFYGVSGTTDTNTTATISANTWTNVALRYDATTGKIEAIINGVGSGGTTLGAATPLAGLWLPFNIGGRYMDDKNTNMLNGFLREVRVYNVRHSDAQVTATVAAMT